ncbi:MAG: nuclear transport factor 2 family protein [Planctomycetota bacterium JB042]
MIDARFLGAGCLVVGSFSSGGADEWEWRSLPLDGGALEYVVAGALEADGEAPVVLGLPPGAQDRGMVEWCLRNYWASEAAARGFVVVAPAARPGRPFAGAGWVDLLPLLDEIERSVAIEGGRPHLVGVSNGGLGAFRFAIERPERVASLCGMPGMPARPEEVERLDRLALLPVAMFVGGEDAAWRRGAEETRGRLAALGATPRLEVLEGEGHVPPSLAGGAELFAWLETARERVRAEAAAKAAVAAVLDDFHAAAAAADGRRYFSHFAPDGVFLGTDATERWSVPEFRAYAAPYFDAGRGWTYVATERHVGLSADGGTAWFDERLHNEKYGEVRGSGALRRIGETWRIAQYNLAFPVPNDLAPDLVERIRAAEDEGGE